MRTILDLEQGTSSWLQWRQEKITGTSAPIIMRLSPWQTRVELWQEKTLGWTKPFTQKELDRMARGTQLEPLAREKFIEDTGILVHPVIGLHDDYDFIGASFDGLSNDHQFVLEIKCGKKSFEMAQSGVIPPYYLAQIHHQMMVAKAYCALYYAFDGTNGIMIDILKDEEFEENLLAEEIKFWHHIQNFTEPEP